MSICNVYADADRAVVAVDTAAMGVLPSEDKTVFARQKAMIHGSAVVACRGYLGLFDVLNQGLVSSNTFWDIDALEISLTGMLSQAFAHWRVTATKQSGVDIGTLGGDTEITAVGWSDTKQQTRALVFTVAPSGMVTREFISRTATAPGVPGLDTTAFHTSAGMMNAARAQALYCQDKALVGAIGGELIVYEVMKDGIIMRKMGAI